MLEIKLVFISSAEILLGASLDTGEVEIEEGQWLKFTRFRIGLLFVTIDFTFFHSPS
jgi:hypothetical protein